MVALRMCPKNSLRAPLISKFTDEVFADFCFQLAIIRVDSSAEGGFRRTSLSQSFENPLQIAHAVGLADVFHGGEGFFISHSGLSAGELHKAAFECVQRDLALVAKQVSQKPTMRDLLGFDRLSNTLVE